METPIKTQRDNCLDNTPQQVVIDIDDNEWQLSLESPHSNVGRNSQALEYAHVWLKCYSKKTGQATLMSSLGALLHRIEEAASMDNTQIMLCERQYTANPSPTKYFFNPMPLLEALQATGVLDELDKVGYEYEPNSDD